VPELVEASAVWRDCGLDGSPPNISKRSTPYRTLSIGDEHETTLERRIRGQVRRERIDCDCRQRDAAYGCRCLRRREERRPA
jgi:hypothetical protein